MSNLQSTRICSIAGCGRPLHNVGLRLCQSHHYRLKRYGDPTKGQPIKGTALAFLRSVVGSIETECILWPFAISGPGYASLQCNGCLWPGHRLVLALKTGINPQGYHACHDCGVRSCVNPNHIRWDTVSGNMADRHKHGTRTCPTPKLTADKVLRIRELRKGGMKLNDIAAQYDICFQMVSNIALRKVWKHI